jgi:hypothetical protein
MVTSVGWVAWFRLSVLSIFGSLVLRVESHVTQVTHFTSSRSLNLWVGTVSWLTIYRMVNPPKSTCAP